MEELQDAIEDAQYVNAIATQEEGPRPVLAWEIPTEEQLEKWERMITKSASPVGPRPFEIDWYLESAIGLFLFSSFLKEVRNDYLRINFVEEIIRWRKMRGKHRVERAKKIVEVYLKELPVDDVTGKRLAPEKSQINEYDLSREVPKLEMSDASFDKLYVSNFDSSKSRNCLGLEGPVLEEIFVGLQQVDESVKAQKRSRENSFRQDEIPEENGNHEDMHNYGLKRQKEKESSLKQLTASLKVKEEHLPNSFFDKVEAIVVESLRREYWVDFTESAQCAKARSFLWFQDRTVVAEDFFTMRVLGRGGFGSVIGTERNLIVLYPY